MHKHLRRRFNKVNATSSSSQEPVAFPRKVPHAAGHWSANRPASLRPGDLARHSPAARPRPEAALQRLNAVRVASANGRSGQRVPAPPPATAGDAQGAPAAGQPGPQPSEVSWLLAARCSDFPVLALLVAFGSALASVSSAPPPLPLLHHGFCNQAFHPRLGFFIHRLGLGEENRRQARDGHWRRANGLRHRAGEPPSGNTSRSLSCPS